MLGYVVGYVYSDSKHLFYNLTIMEISIDTLVTPWCQRTDKNCDVKQISGRSALEASSSVLEL